jgi:MFS-type transporter involved in bile tolerance (Atg22 family)
MNSGAAGGFALFFLAVIVFSIVRSKKKLKTVLYTLVAMAIAFAAGVLAGFAFADYAGAIGTLTGGILVPFTGMLCAWGHSRKSRAGRESAP